MLSQLTKTIKLALKSTEEERAILRARSAVQRFPVVEWRQRLEDFQRRSITVSRVTAGDHAWGFDTVDSLPPSNFYMQDGGSTTSLAGGWNRPGTPDSAPPSPMPESRRLSNSPRVPSPNAQTGYFENNNNNLSAGANYHDRFGKDKRNRQSAESFYDEDPNASPLYYEDNRRKSSAAKPKFFQGTGYDDEDVPSSQASSDHGSHHGHPRETSQQTYDSFLAAANKQFSKQSGGRNAPDPYFDARASQDGRNSFAPSRPFSMHSRVSSFDSISSIVDEKGASSPLNKAMESVSDGVGMVAKRANSSLPIPMVRLRRALFRN